MKTFKKYLFLFALFMVVWMSFNALMILAYKTDYNGWIQYVFAGLVIIITEVIGTRIYNYR